MWVLLLVYLSQTIMATKKSARTAQTVFPGSPLLNKSEVIPLSPPSLWSPHIMADLSGVHFTTQIEQLDLQNNPSKSKQKLKFPAMYTDWPLTRLYLTSSKRQGDNPIEEQPCGDSRM